MTTTHPAAALPVAALDRLPEVAAALATRAEEHDRDGSFPFESVAAVHDAGLLTATVAPRYGGPGLGLADTVRILRALGTADPSVALVTAMTLFTHAAQASREDWPAGYYAQLLDDSAAGPALVNALRVEPELGTPARGGLPATVARRSGDHWSLTGRKIFSTGAVGLRWMLVWARTDEPEVRVGSFLVRSGTPGVTIEPTWDHLGLRASRSDDVLLDGVRVPLDAVAWPSGPDTGPRVWNALGLTALYLGVADAARDWLVRFLNERTPTALGKPLATLSRFQTAVGQIEADLIGAGQVVDALAARFDAGDPGAVADANVGKLLGTRAAISTVEQAVALVGNPALTRHNPLQRHLRDVLCSRVHTPQDDVILTAAGQAALNRKGQA